MDEKNKAGQQAGSTAAGTEGKEADTSAAKIAELEARLATETARANKEAKDKEIYRSGLLVAKQLGKSKKAEADGEQKVEDVDEIVEKKLAEKELISKAESEAVAIAEEREKLQKENEELKRSLEAKHSSSGFAGGAGHSETSESKPVSYFSEEQKAELRQIYESRGFYKPEVIEKMMIEAEKNALSYSRKGTGAHLEKGNTMFQKRQY